MLYPVNEVFESIQGEATFTGAPSLFLRLQGCPVGCAWCDTKHTWELRQAERVDLATMLAKDVDAPTWSALDVADLAGLLERYRARHVVITGGEPCAYDLGPLVAAIAATGRTAQVETSGTQPVSAGDAWVTVSPKLGMRGGLDVRDDALARADEIKHPIGRLQDYEALCAHVLPRVRPGVPIWLQPLSASPAATRLCVELATLHGHRVSVQVHRYLGVR